MSSSPHIDHSHRQTSTPPKQEGDLRFSPSFDRGPSVGILEDEFDLDVKVLAPFDGARATSIPRGQAWCAPGVHRA
jgi:hypothetical protein